MYSEEFWIPSAALNISKLLLCEQNAEQYSKRSLTITFKAVLDV